MLISGAMCIMWLDLHILVLVEDISNDLVCCSALKLNIASISK